MSMKELQKQTDANISAKADLIWQIATHLVGLFTDAYSPYGIGTHRGDSY